MDTNVHAFICLDMSKNGQALFFLEPARGKLPKILIGEPECCTSASRRWSCNVIYEFTVAIITAMYKTDKIIGCSPQDTVFTSVNSAPKKSSRNPPASMKTKCFVWIKGLKADFNCGMINFGRTRSVTEKNIHYTILIASFLGLPFRKTRLWLRNETEKISSETGCIYPTYDAICST